MNKVKTDHENYERDLESNAVLNNDIASYTAYKKQRDNMLRTMSELDILKNEMVAPWAIPSLSLAFKS